MRIQPHHRAGRTALLALLMAAALVAPTTFAQGTANAPAAYVPDPVTTTSQALSGKLFFTDAKRKLLDKARKDGVQIFEEEVVHRSTVLNGFVRSSDGTATYWLNSGRPGDTRYVDVQDGSATTSSTMIGPASNVKFRGANEGAARAVDAKGNSQLREKPKSIKTKPTKNDLPVQESGERKRP